MKGKREEYASAERRAEYRETICGRCDFYKPGESLECGAFKILVTLIESGSVSLKEVEDAAFQIGREGSAEKI